MYRIIGADGREYGPVTAEQLRQWIAAGRVNEQTRIQAEGSPDWKPLADFPELSGETAGTSPPLVSVSAAPTAPKTNGMAITGLVMGILSLIQCCSFIFGTLGIIFSSVGISQINRRPSELTGKGMAVAGLVMSIVGLSINAVFIVIYWAAIMAAFASHH